MGPGVEQRIPGDFDAPHATCRRNRRHTARRRCGRRTICLAGSRQLGFHAAQLPDQAQCPEQPDTPPGGIRLPRFDAVAAVMGKGVVKCGPVAAKHTRLVGAKKQPTGGLPRSPPVITIRLPGGWVNSDWDDVHPRSRRRRRRRRFGLHAAEPH